MIMPVGQLIMAQVAGPQRMGRVMGIVSMPAMLAPILGPVVGGVILQNLHWSWIFFVNLPIGVVAFVLGLARCCRRPTPARPASSTWSASLCLPTGAAAARLRALRTRLRRSRRLAPIVLLPIARRSGADRRVHLATRCASSGRCSTCACMPTGSSRGVADDLRPRRRAVRRNDPGAPLLPGGAPRERDRHRPAHRPQGLGMLLVDAARRPYDRALRRRSGGDRRRRSCWR